MSGSKNKKVNLENFQEFLCISRRKFEVSNNAEESGKPRILKNLIPNEKR